MPELPDVETFRRYIDATSLHKTISGVTVKDNRILHNTSEHDLKSALNGAAFESTRRHGKNLFVPTADGSSLYMHFGMTGFVRYHKEDAGDLHHVRFRVDFDNGYHLSFSNQRLLGKIGLAGDIEAFLDENDIGPDALDLDENEFAGLAGGRRGTVKGFLMNQKYLAGIGNVYADEILYQAGIHPEAVTGQLGDEALHSLHRTLRRVLDEATDRQADPDNFPVSWLTPRREEGKACPRCEGKIEKIRVSGRATYFCPSCQDG